MHNAAIAKETATALLQADGSAPSGPELQGVETRYLKAASGVGPIWKAEGDICRVYPHMDGLFGVVYGLGWPSDR